MSISIVQLGSPRSPGEGTRIGTVRRPPRGVRKERYAAEDWYDTWLPELSPSPDLMKQGREAETAEDWAAFAGAFEKEMAAPPAARLLDLLATLSHGGDFSVGCYCDREDRCHRSILRRLLAARGAEIR